MKKQIIENALSRVAKKYGITEEEVRKQLQKVFAHAISNQRAG